ncbi:S8 family peptidase [Xanthomonas albilineans]|uniref:S8 family peptidase n=1 Tax=Xanthomonas albilineans TaxID=29447 RepID=UPI001E553646|nr:S8 family peptidase [Xanthomonas albilineans]
MPIKQKDIPSQPRQQHAASLQVQIEDLKPAAAEAVRVQQELQLESGLGLQIQFTSQPDVVLAFESLANAHKKIELLSVREEGNRTLANVFVPDGGLAHFERYIADYLAEKKDSKNRALDHQKLLDAIESIRAAEITALWTDAPELLPADPTTVFWWEVWLPVRGAGQRQAVVEDFKKLARLADCLVNDKQFNFPERTVLLMYGSQQQLSRSVMTLNCVAELRYAKETAKFFDGMEVEEQRQWADDLLRRAEFQPADDAPRVCLLDTGVTRAHPLLEPLMDAADLHTVEPAWGLDDLEDHGTGQAGLAAYGDLTDALSSVDAISVPHRLESVKLVPAEGANEGDARHHAYLFMEGVARPEISAPDRARVFTSAVTASDYRDRGRPSSWSAAVDDLAADANGEGENPRLFVLSAGNNSDANAWATYPDCLATNLVHDPGQAWNAITVGACTDKIDTQEHSSWNPIAEAGGLSPFTTTTQTWDRAWPLKPDVVLEGGNAVKNDLGASSMDSLSLLTTHNKPQARLFTTSNATSAASALCAGMAARIMAAYPHLRAETVRALLVHSAQWSDTMRAIFLPAAPNKDHFVNLIRHCGWGKPDLNRALWSASDSLTLVVEDLVYPYTKVQGKGVVTRDMNLHSLPWPKDELEALQDTPVEMRVTLSYFIEPNPSTRGVASKYHYPSHRLRFDVQRPLDNSTDHFIARLNPAAQREDEGDGDPVNSYDPNWLLGGKRRHRGSLHQDVWKGTAAELASRGFIAVYPSAGWWRTRSALERYGLPARYSLVVSIQTQQTDVDLYAAVAQKIPVANAVVVGT